MVQETSFGNDRDQKTIQQPLPREQGVMLVTRSGHNPYLKKGERD